MTEWFGQLLEGLTLTRSMMTSPTTEGRPDVPAQVFEKFLHALEGAGVSAEMVARLRKTLLEDKTCTESVLKAAVLGEESLT